ncbi:MAG: hypothetical protein PHC84_00580 [Clostridia bacterium]|nr:hypothetical protein [Clostridia bacterium]
MKKLSGFPAILGASVLAALAVLYFTDLIRLWLWVKYLSLFSCLAIIISLYTRYGKRTLFDDCIYCLRKAQKKLDNLNFNKKDRLVGLDLLTVKNYLAFAEKYAEDIYFMYDLHILKEPLARLASLSEILTRSHKHEVMRDKNDILLFLTSLRQTITEEYNKILAKKSADRAAAKQKQKTK